MTKDHKQVRLGDFGLAKEVKGNEYASRGGGVSRLRLCLSIDD
jgi:hypothetical protein